MRLNQAVCYLCLDAVDEAGQLLRRDCACRGTDAGFVHLSCLVTYAEVKSTQARDTDEFVNLWETCPGCHQYYQNELRIDIATKFVSFVRRQYPHDTQKQVESLDVKRAALMAMFDRLHPVQKKEAGVTTNVLLSLIDRMKGDAPLTMRYSQMEAYAYHTHGRIAFAEGTEDSARRAVVHFEQYLKVCKAIGDDEGIATAKSNIAAARSKYEGENKHDELLTASQELYELRIAEHGEEHYYTIDAGIIYAHRLQKSNRRKDARELLMKLLATSKQVFGSDHNTTKEIESML
jgi:hypothetical protein